MEEKVCGQGEGKKEQGIFRRNGRQSIPWRVRGHCMDYLRHEKTKSKSCTKRKSEGKDLT